MRSRLLVLALAALVALAIAACDEDGGPSTPAASPSPGASPSPEAAAFAFDCDAAPLSPAPDAAGFPVEVTDPGGVTVTLDEPPQSISSLSAGHTEILYAIGAGDQVSAVDSTSDCPAAARGLPQVDAFSPSVEAIAGLQPDLVVIFFDPGDLQSALSDLGIPVLNMGTPSSIEEVYEQARLLGQATGHSSGAEQLVFAMRTAVEAIRSGIGEVSDPPSVFHEISNDYFTAGPGSFVADLYETLGADNIATATGEAFPQMSAEAIIEADPDVIVLADEDAGETPDTVAARPGWSEIAAVRNGRVHVVDPDIVSRPGPRLVEALRTLATYLYPLGAP